MRGAPLFLPMLLTVTVFAASACGRSGDSAGRGEDTPTGAAAVAGGGSADTDVASAVKSRLGDDKSLEGLSIAVTASGGGVTLTGEVVTREQRDRALELARSVPGVSEVDDRIQITPDMGGQNPSPKVPPIGEEAQQHPIGTTAHRSGQPGEVRSDAWITAKVKAELLLDRELPAREIDVDTESGVVTLTGRVRSAAARSRAEQTARDIEGVSRVVNRLTVSDGADR